MLTYVSARLDAPRLYQSELSYKSLMYKDSVPTPCHCSY